MISKEYSTKVGCTTFMFYLIKILKRVVRIKEESKQVRTEDKVSE